MNINEVINKLKNSDAKARIMEVCGTHTHSIAHNGIRQILPNNVQLVSGPGCPVCVTVPGYIDKLVDAAFLPNTTVLSFGDLFKVKGTKYSFGEAKAIGATVELIYSPLDALKIAVQNPTNLYIIAAVGFETTIPVYAILLEEIIEKGINNIKLMTSLKATPPALSFICEQEKSIDGFLCPGHVAAIIGSNAFAPLAEKYQKPFITAGFEGEHIITALYRLTENIKNHTNTSENFYPGVVAPNGNPNAIALIDKYFEFSDAAAVWRGIGFIEGSAYILKKEYAVYDYGSADINTEFSNSACRCGEVLLGRITPKECPLFGKACTPDNAIGACMVSEEGACGIWYST